MERGPVLVCLEGKLAGREFPITAEGLRVGRDEGNEIHIDDAGISRQHARILLHNGAVWVQDAGSRNGIFVNGERVPDHRQVKVGDQIQVGASLFEVGVPATPGQPAASNRPRPSTPRAPSPGTSLAPKRASWQPWVLGAVALMAVLVVVCAGVALKIGLGAAG